MRAAELTISAWEAKADRKIGRDKRRACERYCSLALIGIPVAYLGAGLRFDAVAGAGLAVGIGLYAIIDVTRAAFTAAKRARAERSTKP